MSEQNLNSTRCMSVPSRNLFGIPMPASALNGYNEHPIWTALMSSWKVLLCWEHPVMDVSFNIIGWFNVKVR